LVHNIIGFFVTMLPIILNVAGWWRWKRVWRDEKAARWRKVVGLVGLVANTSALCLVCVSLFYSVAVEKAHREVFQSIDLYPVIVGCLILSASALAVGTFAPRRLRLAVVLGGFAMGWWLLLVLGSGGVL
ncbi:MAG: hypothetical protein WAM47_20215, partial [Candidatus Sulfotelmatobacter sp.]